MNNHRICLNGEEIEAEIINENTDENTIEFKFETDSITPDLSTKIYVDAMERDVEFNIIPKEDTLNLVEAIEEPVEEVKAESTSNEETNEESTDETKSNKSSNKTIFIGVGVVLAAIIILVLRKLKK